MKRRREEETTLGSSSSSSSSEEGEDEDLLLLEEEEDHDDSCVKFSLTDKDDKVTISKDGLQAKGFKGYRSVRVTHGVPPGSGRWFCEMKVVGDGGHVRVGWTTKAARIEGPVGFCKNGYGFRDIDGSKVHDGWRKEYNKQGAFGKGDVVGLMIDLPKTGESEISFLKNGVDLGVAFEFVAEPGKPFFATASMFQEGQLELSAGPDFAFPPGGKKTRPLSDAVTLVL